MANLMGRLRSYTKSGYPASKEVTRLAGGEVELVAETWKGKASLVLREDGQFSLEIGPKSGRGTEIVMGNVNSDGRFYLVTEEAPKGNDKLRESHKRFLKECD